MKRRQILLAVLILALTLSLAVVCSADDWGAIGDLRYEISDAGEVTITAYYGSEKDVVIPEMIEGYPVTAIGEMFSCHAEMESLTLPATIKRMQGSFYNLKKLHITDLAAWCTIEFEYDSSNPLYCGADLYLNGSLITDLVVPESVTQIGASIFCGYERLKSVTIHDGVTSIGSGTFDMCDNLESVYIEDLKAWCEMELGWNGSPLSYAEKLYVGGSEITGLLSIPNGTTKISDWAFWDFKGFQSLYIPDTVKEIGPMALTGSINLEQILVDPTNSEFCAQDGVLFNKDRTELLHYPAGKTDSTYTIPATVTTISAGSIRRCQYLKNVIIGDNVTTIGLTTLCENPVLESITIGKGVKSVDDYVFEQCPNLTKIEITDLAAWCEADVTASFYKFNQDRKLYLNGQPITKLVIPESVTTIKYGNFSGCTTIESIVLHDGITLIKSGAFSGCKNITDIWYTGSDADWANIQIEENSYFLSGAVRHYNACTAGAEHTYDDACDTQCNVCQKTRTVEHDYEWVVDGKEDCGNDGVKHEECKVCHAKRNENTPITATGLHTYDNACDTVCNVCEKSRTVEHDYEWVIDQKETCGGNGVKHEECTVCHTKRNIGTPITATGEHTYVWVVDLEETCGDSGIKHEECSVCHASRNEQTKIPATGRHVYDDAEDSQCNVCRQTREAGHDFRWIIDKEPTCNEPGLKHEKCTICKEERNKGTEIPALTHSFGQWQVTTEAKCEAAGEKTRTCALCGGKETEQIPALEHEFTISDTSRKLSCTEDGTEIMVCTRCGKENITVLKAEGHKYGEAVVVKVATEEETGLKQQTCTVCGDVKEEVIPVIMPGEPPAGTENEEPQNNLWWIIIVVAGILVLGMIIFLILKKRSAEEKKA